MFVVSSRNPPMAPFLRPWQVNYESLDGSWEEVALVDIIGSLLCNVCLD